jgi:hypothetical protein
MKKISFMHVFIFVVIAVIVITNFKTIKATAQKALPFTAGPETGASKTQTIQVGGLDYDKQLISGATGPEVEQLQTWINQAGYNPPLVVDGKFGIKTSNAVKFYNNGSAAITLRQATALILKGMQNIGLF